MYFPSKQVLSTESYTLLNNIRTSIGGEFMTATPLVQTAEDAKAYGLYVTGGGEARNAFMSELVNRIGKVMVDTKMYTNSLKRFKRGMLEVGEMVENVWVGLVSPEGYTHSVTTPGDLYKTNKPDCKVTFHPVNSKLFYEVTTNESELQMAFTSTTGAYDLVARIVSRLTDSSEWDEFIKFKYVIARAILENAGAVKKISTLNATNSDAILTSMKTVSNEMEYMNTTYDIAAVPTHTPKENQVFVVSAAASAVFDVNSLASAFNLSYKDFMGQRQAINTFGFSAIEIERLNTIMTETAAQGLVPNYTPFTEAELDELEGVKAAIIDEDFFMIFDRLIQTEAVYDARHLNTNNYLHIWQVLSYNPFANSVFFSDYVAPVTP